MVLRENKGAGGPSEAGLRLEDAASHGRIAFVRRFLAVYEQAKAAEEIARRKKGGPGPSDAPHLRLLEDWQRIHGEERARMRAKALEAEEGTGLIEKIGHEGMEARPRQKLFGEVPRIEGARIVLDRIVDTDAAALDDLAGNDHVYRLEPTYLFERQYADAHETIRLVYADLFERKESLILAIRLRQSGELTGLAEFYGLRDSLHKVSIGYRLRERFWGRGLATDAARLMVRYLYRETDIEIITASTMVDNAASAHVLEKSGFIRTSQGVTEDWGYPDPTIVDKWFC